MPDPVPTELVAAARTGGTVEIERLLEAIWPDAYRLAYAVLRDRQCAEDAAQEASVIVYRTIASLRNLEAFRAWFYRIVVRAAASVSRRRITEDLSQEPDSAVDDCTVALDVWRAISTLPQHLRDVIVLRYFEDLPSREIAAILRIHDGAVRFRLMVARRRLRPLLGDVFEDATGSASEVGTSAI
ncbi:MAG: RNA polymerase sigma factor [Candidatus Cybelea sp.]